MQRMLLNCIITIWNQKKCLNYCTMFNFLLCAEQSSSLQFMSHFFLINNWYSHVPFNYCTHLRVTQYEHYFYWSADVCFEWVSDCVPINLQYWYTIGYIFSGYKAQCKNRQKMNQYITIYEKTQNIPRSPCAHPLICNNCLNIILFLENNLLCNAMYYSYVQ